MVVLITMYLFQKFLFKMSQQKFYKKYLKEHRAAIHTPELIAHVRNVLNY